MKAVSAPSPFRSTSRFVVLLCAAGGLAAALTCCSSAAPPVEGPEGASQQLPEAERYFPLTDGHIYQYSSRNRDGKNGFMVLTVARDQDKATLSTGNTVQSLQVRPDGIYNESGFYVLKLPLSLGSQWAGQSGTIEVTGVHQSVTTEAGTFSNCIVTREITQGTVELRTTRTTFCPGVGLVRLDAEATSPNATATESVVLKYFGAPIDVSAL